MQSISEYLHRFFRKSAIPEDNNFRFKFLIKIFRNVSHLWFYEVKNRLCYHIEFFKKIALVI